MEMVVWVLCFRVSLKVLICDQNGGHFFCRALVVIFNALNQIFLRKQEIQVCQSADVIYSELRVWIFTVGVLSSLVKYISFLCILNGKAVGAMDVLL